MKKLYKALDTEQTFLTISKQALYVLYNTDLSHMVTKGGVFPQEKMSPFLYSHKFIKKWRKERCKRKIPALPGALR